MKALFTLLIIAVSLPVFAQFNDTINYYVNHTSTGVINKTNDGSSYVLNNGLKFNIYKKSASLNTTNTWIYGKNQNGLTNNDYSAVIDLNLFKNARHLYYWALGNFDKSYSLKINHRLQAGTGIGYYVIDHKTFVMQLSDGLLYENSDLYDSETSSNKNEILRNSFRIKFRLVVKEILTIDGSDFLQNSLRDKDDYIIKSNTNLSLKLQKWLSLTVSFTYNKLNVTGRENLLLTYGLTLERYF
jgi:hypothetical protein